MLIFCGKGMSEGVSARTELPKTQNAAARNATKVSLFFIVKSFGRSITDVWIEIGPER
jgi:hypothetical protein